LVLKVTFLSIYQVLNPDKVTKSSALLKINGMGLIGSKRKNKDGCVYFGYLPDKIKTVGID
jgi:hypothetical protein